MSAPLVTPSRDAAVEALPCTSRCYPATRGNRHSVGCVTQRADAAEGLIASGAVIDAAALTDDETVRAVAYRFAEGEATYAASTVRHVLRALVDVLAERGEQHG